MGKDIRRNQGALGERFAQNGCWLFFRRLSFHLENMLIQSSAIFLQFWYLRRTNCLADLSHNLSTSNHKQNLNLNHVILSQFVLDYHLFLAQLHSSLNNVLLCSLETYLIKYYCCIVNRILPADF